MSVNPKLVHRKQACTHCGTSFHPSTPEEEFCCSGCAFVHDMITNEGLDRFYDLKGKATTRPVQNLAFERRDYEWLEQKMERSEAGDASRAELELGLEGATCAGCVWLIERVFSKEPGALQILTDPVQGRVEMTWESGRFDGLAFANTLQQYGYNLCPLDPSREPDRDPLLGRVGLCAAFAMNGMAFALPRYLGMPADFMFAGLFQLITALSATLAMAVGGSYFIRRAWNALQEGVLHVDVPIVLGVSLAYLGSLVGWLLGMESMLYFDFVAVFVFLMLGGRWVQDQAMRRNQRRLYEQDALPQTVLVEGQPVALSELQEGQVYEIRPNQIVPVASRILSESAPLGMEWIQGESDTREQARGSVAASGAIYRGRESLSLEARETWGDSLLYRLTKNEAMRKDHPFLQQVLRVYLWVVLVIGLAGGAAWAFGSGEISKGLQVTLSIFVISCPCALGVAIPLADEFAAAAARKLGVFVQQLSFWSRLRRVRRVLFDKTGTLTLDTPKLINVETLQALGDEERGALATLAAASSHPISRSLSETLAADLQLIDMDQQIEEQPGVGLRFTDRDGRQWSLTRPKGTSRSDVDFMRDGSTLATFCFEDTLRDGAAEEVQLLEKGGLECHILSGDRESKVASMASELGLSRNRWVARMTPDEKADLVDALDCRDTLYVGDGVNDSLAFDHAYATATPAFDRNLLSDKADCYFVTRGLTFLTSMIGLARRRHRVILNVFTFAVIYNIGAIAICLAGNMNPLLAAILMPISSVVTTVTVALGFKRVGRS